MSELSLENLDLALGLGRSASPTLADEVQEVAQAALLCRQFRLP